MLANDKSILKFYLIASTIVNALIILLVCSLARADDTIAVQTVAWESSNQSFIGQVAVASVIKTRMVERHQTSKAVCKAPYQFSCWHPKTGKATQQRRITDKERAKAKQAWDIAVPGKYNHYCRYDVKPAWTKAAKSSVRIGDHVFYEL